MAGIPNWIIDGIKKILPNPEIKGNKILCGGDTFNINIHLTNVPTNSDEITFDNDKKEFNINTAALDESKNKQIEQLVYETFEEKKPILIQRSKEMLDDYVKTSQDENILSATKYLHGKVPDNDLTIWHEALYCKSIFDKMIHIPEIKNRQILQMFKVSEGWSFVRFNDMMV
jgi:hypothetical protein